MPACSYMEQIGLSAMLVVERLADVLSDVTLRIYVRHTTPPRPNKSAHSGFETQRHQQKAKIGLSVAPQKGLIASKTYYKKISGDLFSIRAITIVFQNTFAIS